MTDLISSEQCEDFIQTCLDFIVLCTISLLKYPFLCYNIVGVLFIKENKLADLSMDFAVEILKICDGIRGHYSIINQLERCATSIGANIREAKYAHSKPDFISKL